MKIYLRKIKLNFSGENFMPLLSTVFWYMRKSWEQPNLTKGLKVYVIPVPKDNQFPPTFEQKEYNSMY